MSLRKWLPEDALLLEKLWPNTPTKEVANLIGKDCQAVYRKAKRMELKRSHKFIENQQKGFAELLRKHGKANQFKKGHLPKNKGVPMAEWLSAEHIEKISKTQFKKGSVPHNVVPIGYRRIGKDGYVEEKVKSRCGNDNFEFVHHNVYKKHFGEIPSGCVVSFIDGNILNFEPSNLILKTMKQNLLDNQLTDSCLAKRILKTTDDLEIEKLIHQAPELIELKRSNVLLNRKIKENVTKRKNKAV